VLRGAYHHKRRVDLYRFRFGTREVLVGYPPPPWSCGIIGLGRFCEKILAVEQLAGKIFRNKDLAGCQRAFLLLLRG
jgi:hypothetical protein